MGNLLSSVWGKVMTGVAGACFALAILFCVLWSFADRAREHEREARLTAEDAAISAEAETKRTQAALAAAETRAELRERQTLVQRRDEETIRDVPESNTCGSSPAIGRALDILRDRRTSDPSTGRDPAESD